MSDKKINIRVAKNSDCKEIYLWRKDSVTFSMSFSNSMPTFKKHKDWFNLSLNNDDIKLYIGEIGSTKIGVCRFDHNIKSGVVDVSINVNPKCRASGLGKRFLMLCILYYSKDNNRDLIAKIKTINKPSLRIFEASGFETISRNDYMITLMKHHKDLYFKEVNEDDSDILYDLLKKRHFSISHYITPTIDEHYAFIKSNPYRKWMMVFKDNRIIGTFYIQKNNSIGINFLLLNKKIISKILKYIHQNFEPLPEVKSKVPPYFYINVSLLNKKLAQILDILDSVPIQVSYKI